MLAEPRRRMRVLGIDFGERRIGLALSDEDGRYALPLQTIERRSDRQALYRIADLVRERQVAALILGEPRGLDGRGSATTERVKRFGERLARLTKVPLYRIDEALTTVEAAARLRDAGLDSRARHQRRDAVAAQILLQEALDRGVIGEVIDG